MKNAPYSQFVTPYEFCSDLHTVHGSYSEEEVGLQPCFLIAQSPVSSFSYFFLHCGTYSSNISSSEDSYIIFSDSWNALSAIERFITKKPISPASPKVSATTPLLQKVDNNLLDSISHYFAGIEDEDQ